MTLTVKEAIEERVAKEIARLIETRNDDYDSEMWTGSSLEHTWNVLFLESERQEFRDSAKTLIAFIDAARAQ